MGLLTFFLLCSIGQAAEDSRTPKACAIPLIQQTASSIDQLDQIGIVLDRLLIRTPRRGDMPSILEIFSDDDTVKYTWFWQGSGYWNLSKVTAKYETFAIDQLKGLRFDFVIEHRATGKVIGRCAVYQHEAEKEWEVGITLNRTVWGNRFAEETLRGLLSYFFENKIASVMWFRTEPEHKAMLAQYERLKIPKVIDASEDKPSPPLFHRYHHFRIEAKDWLNR